MDTHDNVYDSNCWYLIAGCAIILIMLIGIAGNFLTVIVLIKSPRIRNVTSIFIVCLCIADMLFCIVVLPFAALRFFGNNWSSVNALCSIIPFMQYANVGVSLLFICMITINRYVIIAHPTISSTIYRPVYVVLMILFCVSMSFGMQLPTLFGVWGEYKYIESMSSCSISEDKWGRSSKTFLYIFGFVIPCIVIIVCYTKIFCIVHKSGKIMRYHVPITPSVDSKRKRNEWNLTKMILAIFVSFLICYLPVTIVKTVDKNVNYLCLHVITYVMLCASACINPIIYVIMNKQYRKAYENVLCCNQIKCCQDKKGKMRASNTSHTMMSQISVTMMPMNSLKEDKLADSQAL